MNLKGFCVALAFAIALSSSLSCKQESANLPKESPPIASGEDVNETTATTTPSSSDKPDDGDAANGIDATLAPKDASTQVVKDGEVYNTSHYPDEWWEVSKEEYKEIVDCMRKDGYYCKYDWFPSEMFPSDIGNNIKEVSLCNEVKEYETSLENDILTLVPIVWYFNNVKLPHSEKLMFVNREGVRLQANIEQLFDEAIAFRPDFRLPETKEEVDWETFNNRFNLATSSLWKNLRPKSFKVVLREIYLGSNDDGETMGYVDCDRFFVITGKKSGSEKIKNSNYDDNSAIIVFACIFESNQAVP